MDESKYIGLPEVNDDSIGSGILYGAVASLGDDGNLGALGLLLYDTITGILNLPDWSLAAARNALTQAPNQQSVERCENLNGTGTPTCAMTFSISISDTTTITNAYQTTKTYAYNYAKKFNFKQSVKAGMKFSTGVFVAKADNSYEASLETGQEWSISETWTDSSSITKTEAKATTVQKTQSCTYNPTVPSGHSIIVTGVQTSGQFSVPYKGNFSYQLKSGATFTFPSAGEFSATLQTGCLFGVQYVLPLMIQQQYVHFIISVSTIAGTLLLCHLQLPSKIAALHHSQRTLH